MMNKFLKLIVVALGSISAQDLSAIEIMENVYDSPKPNSSIMEIRLEIIRIKRQKEKVKLREFTRYEKLYDSGKYSSKSLARFQKPSIVKGTGLLSWVHRKGGTDQWFFLPKLKSAKRVSSKQRSKSFLNTDFIYEDLEIKKLGSDSLKTIGVEYEGGIQCKVLMAWPKKKSSYFSRKIWVNTQNWQIYKIEYYITESEKEKTLTLSNFIEKDGFTTPGRMIMEKENGNKTIMEISSFKPNIGLNEEIFSESFLIKF